MADPITVGLVTLKVGAKIFGASRRRKAKDKAKLGRRLQKLGLVAEAVSNRRSFRRAARTALAQAKISAIASGADVTSSVGQANLQSLRTQEAFQLSQSVDAQTRALQITDLTGRVAELQSEAQGVESLASAVSSLDSIIPRGDGSVTSPTATKGTTSTPVPK
jgi:hypothetical protein